MRLYGEDFIVDETVLVGQVVDGRPFSLPGSKGPIRLRLLHVFQLREGRIAREKVWFDLGDVKRQLGGVESTRAARALPAAARPRRAVRAPGAAAGGKKTLRKQRGR